MIAAVTHALATMRALRNCDEGDALVILEGFETTPLILKLQALDTLRGVAPAPPAPPMRRQHGRIFAKDYSVSDPSDDLAEAIGRLHHALFPITRQREEAHAGTVTISRGDAHLLEAAAGTWLHFGAHPASTKMILAQLREVRRFVGKT